MNDSLAPAILSEADEARLEEFESQWRAGRVPDLREFINDRTDANCVFALLAVDLEYRWKEYGNGRSSSPANDDRFPPFPRVEDYAALLPKQQQAILSARLIAEEYRVRCRWGDCPERRAMLNRFKEIRDDLSIWLDRISEDIRIEVDRCSQPASLGESIAATKTWGAEPTTTEGFILATHSGDSLPQRIGKYEIQGELGAGGMGRVFKAWDPDLEQVVVLKMIRSAGMANPAQIEYFKREARALAQVQHPHIVRVHYAELHTAFPYIVMEFVPGGSLDKHLDRFRHNVRGIVQLVAKLATAVGHIHRYSLLHRDLKPANILLDESGEPKISDFGLAKFVGRHLDASEHAGTIGTPVYMAPEQTHLISEDVSSSTDVWALGVILFELLTGTRPFDQTDRVRLFHSICNCEPTSLTLLNANVDTGLEAVVLKCLAKQPQRRFETASFLAEELHRWLDGEMLQTRPDGTIRRIRRVACKHPFRIGLVSTLLVILCAIPYLYYSLHPDRELWKIENELASGQQAVLIGDKGPPRWQQTVLPELMATGVERDGYYSIESAYEFGLVELIKDPRHEDWRFTAEVRHDNSELPGEVGVFALYSSVADSAVRTDFIVRIAFNDIMTPQPPLGIVLPAGVPTGNRVEFGPHIRADFGRKSPNHLRMGGSSRSVYFTPIGRNAHRWRRIALESRGGVLTGHFDGRSLGTLQLGHLQSEVNGLLMKRDIRQRHGLNSRSALGLMVSRGKAAFRNVTITPIPHELERSNDGGSD